MAKRIEPILCSGIDVRQDFIQSDTGTILKKYFDTRGTYRKHAYFTDCYLKPYQKMYEIDVRDAFNNMDKVCIFDNGMPMDTLCKSIRYIKNNMTLG